MRSIFLGVFLICSTALLFAQDPTPGPSDKKAQKSYQQGLQSLQQREPDEALWYFRDADKQDHGHCVPCQEQMVQLGLTKTDWKDVEVGASELASEMQEPKQQAVAHYYLGMALEHQGIDGHVTDLLSHAHDEFAKAISLSPLPDIVFEDGKTFAQLHKDEEAKAEFQKFVAMTPEGAFQRHRAEQFINKPDLARANMVPEFAVRTADNHVISARELEGKVVLVYFWASTCDMCNRALPRVREIAKKFQSQPFVLLSISVDYQEPAWRSFLEKNDMPGMQYRDGYNGPLAQVFHAGLRFQSNVDHPLGGVGNSMAGVWRQSFGMNEDVPKTFTIDANGVLQSEKLSDSLDATLQQLIDSTGQNAAKN